MGLPWMTEEEDERQKTQPGSSTPAPNGLSHSTDRVTKVTLTRDGAPTTFRRPLR